LHKPIIGGVFGLQVTFCKQAYVALCCACGRAITLACCVCTAYAGHTRCKLYKKFKNTNILIKAKRRVYFSRGCKSLMCGSNDPKH